MRKVDGYLSKQAQEEWPTAIVWKEEISSGTGPTERFILERYTLDDIILGHQFKEARAGLAALLSSERSKKSTERKED